MGLSDTAVMVSLIVHLVLGIAVIAWIAVAIYASIAIIWIIPDRRIERTLTR